MSRFATGLDGNDVDLDKCRECAHHEATAIFDLYLHAQSHYHVAGKPGHHTIGHMRTVGPCRREATLFSPVVLKKARR